MTHGVLTALDRSIAFSITPPSLPVEVAFLVRRPNVAHDLT